MAEDGGDLNRLEMTILKSLANFFKIHKRWRSSFEDFSVAVFSPVWQDLFKIIITDFVSLTFHSARGASMKIKML